ncbi:hypothetical protein [Mycolicibacterium fortuitum]|uniref:hypothetical protein n=1 Tax=Mycolicibacterium fortuitum TaxID=1766 RepID=UPI0026257536|nr:hypothetical protein [Mycolicibacterium fortuitum]
MSVEYSAETAAKRRADLLEQIRSHDIIINSSKREIAKLEKELATSLRPVEPLPLPAHGPTGVVVVTFQKKYPIGGTYTYAAIRSGSGPAKWCITQTLAAKKLRPMLTWNGLLDFIGEENWGSIVELRPHRAVDTDPSRGEPAQEGDINVAEKKPARAHSAGGLLGVSSDDMRRELRRRESFAQMQAAVLGQY